MLMEYLVKAHQAEIMREAKQEQLVDALSSQPNRLTLLAQRALARWRATLLKLEQTRPIRRRASGWLGQR